MWLRRAFSRWLLPAALVLPVWLLVGWIAFSASGWALLWVLLVAMPSVLVGQLVLTLLVRARPTVRAERAVSWWDVAGFGLWHLLTIAVGCFPRAAFWALLAGAVVVFLGLLWLSLWQLLREARPSLLRTRGGAAFLRPPSPAPTATAEPDVFIVTERRDQP